MFALRKKEKHGSLGRKEASGLKEKGLMWFQLAGKCSLWSNMAEALVQRKQQLLCLHVSRQCLLSLVSAPTRNKVQIGPNTVPAASIFLIPNSSSPNILRAVSAVLSYMTKFTLTKLPLWFIQDIFPERMTYMSIFNLPNFNINVFKMLC